MRSLLLAFIIGMVLAAMGAAALWFAVLNAPDGDRGSPVPFLVLIAIWGMVYFACTLIELGKHPNRYFSLSLQCGCIVGSAVFLALAWPTSRNDPFAFLWVASEAALPLGLLIGWPAFAYFVRREYVALKAEEKT